MSLRGLRRHKSPEREPSTHVTYQEFMKGLKSAPQMSYSVPMNNSTLRGEPGTSVGLLLAATAAVVVSVSGLYLLGPKVDTPGRLIATGANEAISAQLADRSVLSLRAHSRVRVPDQLHLAYVEAGEVMVEVPAGLSDPYIVDALGVRAIVPAQAKFRVAVSAQVVAFEVFAGLVLLDQRAINPSMPVRRLQKGDFVRVPIEAVASLVLQRHGGLSVRMDG